MTNEQTRYSRLAQVTKLINTNLELRVALEHVVTAISEEIVSCDSVGIYLPQEDNTYRGFVGKPDLINGVSLDMHVVDTAHDHLAKEVIETREPIYIPDTSLDSRPDQRAVEAFGIKSLLVLPMAFEKELYGLVFLFDYGIPMNLQPSEIESIEAYVNMAAVAVRNAKNLTKKESLIADKQLLLNVTRELSMCSSLQEVMDKCFEYLGEVLDNPNIGAHLLDPVASRHINPASLSKDSEWSEEEWKRTHRHLALDFKKDLVFQEVLTKKKSIYIPDTEQDLRPNHEACNLFGIKGIYMIPLIAAGKVLGTVAIVNLSEQNYPYSKTAMQLAESIVDATAPVLSYLLYIEKQELIISERTSELTQKNNELEHVIHEVKQIGREKELILNSAGEGIFGLDLKGFITFCNPSAANLLGYYHEKELIGHSSHHIFPNCMLDESASFSPSNDSGRRAEEEFFHKKNGERFPVEFVITPQIEKQQTVGYVVTFKDITHRRQMEEKIKYHAYYDSITNLPNRVLFQDRLHQALKYAELYGTSLGVLFLDLDRFKKINDTFGHTFGDQVLKKIADRLVHTLPKETTISRQGGDEFTILLPSIQSKQEAKESAREVLHVFSDALHVNGQEVFVKTSIGISVFPDNGMNSEQLIKHADVAMYKAKKLSGNQFQLYAPELEDRTVESVEFENDLYRALMNEELTILYQPKYNSRKGVLIGVEALLRWNRPNKGIIKPKEFIPLAEETGLIIPMGEWILRQACLQTQAWHEQGFQDITVSVNLSPQQFNQDELVGHVKQILEETRLSPDCLELELTENLIIHNTKKTRSIIHQLKDLGVQISIDDFGTGYSSLGYLKDFPVDALKIDKTFIDDLPGNPANAAITNTIITLANSLRLNVIAEGVEKKEQLDYLNANGCHLIQGYYYSKPVEAEKAMEQMHTNLKK
ncbi:EAL domain-containing protein [Halobacillus sp. A5]|uniref:bifunctional diguanylate cyclase/phosphodiesterase n=1 Tax=Halobacillus sp. A5 TaxID=2880263 RepID=UPI0020A6D05F|nr:EAL domain-containing protein [Halobacillus sp. A5]MCP3029377.1 EAL domain-containing protein [Halobacillus sp. A5]